MKLLKISELERLSGVPRYTIHQYVSNGLLPAPMKTSRTMAYYDDSHLERLRAIQEIKGSSRVPLPFLKKMLDERSSEAGTDDRAESAARSGAPQRETAEERRRQIRDAALKIFLEKGYQGARIQDITEAAGISTGTFYIYYDDKREVFMDAIDELTKSTVAKLKEAAASGGGFTEATAAVARFYLENYDSFSGIINQLRGLMASAEPSARDKFKALHNNIADPITSNLRSAMDMGVIREMDPALLARAIMGVVEFLSIHLSFDDRYTSEQAISFMFDLLMNGLGRR